MSLQNIINADIKALVDAKITYLFFISYSECPLSPLLVHTWPVLALVTAWALFSYKVTASRTV